MFNKLITLRTPDDTARDRSATRRRRRAARSAPAVRTRRSRLRAARRVRQRSRRGVLLLVVLSMLVLFLLMGTAFVISARQEQAASKSIAKASQVAAARTAESSLLDEVLGQIVRDTKNTSSSLRSHSLLLDMYGNDGYTSVIDAQRPADNNGDQTTVRWPGIDPTGGPVGYGSTAGQILEIDLQRFQDSFGRTYRPSPGPTQYPLPEDLAGRWLTFTSGVVRGQTVSILASRLDSTGQWVRLTVVAPKTERGTNLPAVAANYRTSINQNDNPLLEALSGARIAINGRAFNGTGVGYDPTLPPSPSAALPATQSLPTNLGYPAGTMPYDGPRLVASTAIGGLTAPLALLPNTAFFDPSQVSVAYPNPPGYPTAASYFPLVGVTPASLATASLGGLGGEDESYDAPDFQNMLLAGMDVRKNDPLIETTWPDPSALVPGHLDRMVLPSLHRPALLNYWKNATGTTGTPVAINPDLLRRVLLRPNWLDHPGFTGSNPEFDAVLSGYQNALRNADGDITAMNVTDAADLVLNRMIYGPWDVDNDNDGVRDSVWVDFGAPVVNGPNGRRYKPLAAILCLDMDGRLNVNAAGSLDLAAAEGDNNYSRTVAGSQAAWLRVASGAQSDVRPAGMGYGPADISMQEALSGDFARLLRGDWVDGEYLPGRYNTDGRPGHRITRDAVDPLAMVTMSDWPSQNPANRSMFGVFGALPDLAARYRMGLNDFGQPVWDAVAAVRNNANRVWTLVADSPYEINLSPASAPGVTGAVGPDGQPGTADDLPSTADAAFSWAELERVLRIYDADAPTLPDRLAILSGVQSPTGTDLSDRLRITTDSAEVAVPNLTIPENLQPLVSQNPQYRRAPENIAELIEIRVRASERFQTHPDGRLPLWPEPLTDANSTLRQRNQLQEVLARITAPELFAGQRLNLNRPLGNGIDDNGNGVVDEPADPGQPPYLEGNAPQPLWPNLVDLNAGGGLAAAAAASVNATAAYSNAQFPGGVDYVWHGDISLSTADDYLAVEVADARQMLARQLYVLALNTAISSKIDDASGYDEYTGKTAEQQALARRIAQWAVNVVDFRDSDNIMTLFVVDYNPFDGWSAPDNPNDLNSLRGGNNRFDVASNSPDDTGFYVWGAEQPELLITETLAWHDRRTDDRATEYAYPQGDRAELMKGARDPNEADHDYDQSVRPQGAAFIELYNPAPQNPAASADTHTFSTRTGARVDMGIRIDARDRTTNQSPVWRITVHKREDAADPNIDDQDQQYAALMRQWDVDSIDPKLRPATPVDRTIYFTEYDPGYDDDGVAFFRRRSLQINQDNTVRPGRYLIVGSGLDQDGDRVFTSSVGIPTGAVAQAAPRIELNANMNAPIKVRMLDQNGRPVRDLQYGFDVQTPSLQGPGVSNQTREQLSLDADANPASLADVAIIDQVRDVADEIQYRRGRTGGAPGTVRTRTRRFTFSEPAHGYPVFFGGSIWDEQKQRYVEAAAPDNSMPIDIPLDGPIGGAAQLSTWLQPNQAPDYLLDPTRIRPAFDIDEALCQLRTKPQVRKDDNGIDIIDPNQEFDPGAGYAGIFLQRLANPLLPWNPMPADGVDPTANGHNPAAPVNPYLTIDASTVNLTVFNSLGSQSSGSENEEEDGTPPNAPMRRFASKERGFGVGNQLALDGQLQADTMASLLTSEPPSVKRKNHEREFMFFTPQNIYDNPNILPGSAGSLTVTRMPYNSLGFLNRPFQNNNQAAAERLIVPKIPFDWLTWNNRPYIGENELLLVPRVPTSQMFKQYAATAGQSAVQTEESPYEVTTGAPVTNQPKPDEPPFAHLENLFFAPPQTGAQATTAPPGTPTGLYRLLEYVDTADLFVNGGTWVNPTVFSPRNGLAVDESDNSKPMPANDVKALLQPPSSAVLTGRRPGRVNLNTVNAQDVYGGLFHSDDPRPTGANGEHPGPPWNAGAGRGSATFVDSRRGYGSGQTPFRLNSSFPTFFANPFRAPTAGDLSPLANMRREGVECTMLRSDASNTTLGDYPLFAAQTPQPYSDAARNAYFRFQPMVRLDNLTTTHSNVYAVWITIGFFEVEEFDQSTTPNAIDLAIYKRFLPSATWFGDLTSDAAALAAFQRVYPHSLKYGKEIGIDTGEVRRLRGFYMIDRSLPAAFERGVDHNMENVVRIRRRIE
ncbi:MAG: hypothetical protein CMJ58_00785 [Planctomycetaceae bacterium]|nr:hypothetical protein [Planctomycetaceae bacterium]